MVNTNDILAIKLGQRYCRRYVDRFPSIQSIVNECCNELNVTPPKLIGCESLVRSFSAFQLRGEPYLIYDGCLVEALCLYNHILSSGASNEDMDKFFFKLFGEECILLGDLLHCLYFAGKYSKLKFSFDDDIGHNSQITELVSCQIYFLIAHELTHTSLWKTSGYISATYQKFVREAIRALTVRDMKATGQSFQEYIFDRTGYFLDYVPENMDEYLNALMVSKRFHHFIEECYCDFMGLKLLLEHYEDPKRSVTAVSSALNYLITQESIRSDMRDGVFHMKDTLREATSTMYFSVLRVQFLLLTLEMNELDDIERAFAQIHDRSRLTERLFTFIELLPDEEAMGVLTDVDLPDIDQKSLVNSLLRQFYCLSIDTAIKY